MHSHTHIYCYAHYLWLKMENRYRDWAQQHTKKWNRKKTCRTPTSNCLFKLYLPGKNCIVFHFSWETENHSQIQCFLYIFHSIFCMWFIQLFFSFSLRNHQTNLKSTNALDSKRISDFLFLSEILIRFWVDFGVYVTKNQLHNQFSI